MKKLFGRELIVLWIALAALVCAALSLNASLKRLAGREEEPAGGEEE